jgi:hypothetical protein
MSHPTAIRTKSRNLNAYQYQPGHDTPSVDDLRSDNGDGTYTYVGYGNYTDPITGANVTVYPGDWIIEAPSGVRLYCSAAQFAELFEPR